MTSHRTANPPPGLSRQEFAVLGLLVLLGVAGIFAAYFRFTRLRIELVAAQQQGTTELARLHRENDRLLAQEKEWRLAQSVPVAPAPSPTPADSSTLSRSERMAALLSLAKVLRTGSNSAMARSEQMAAERQLSALAILPAALRENLPAPVVPAYLVIGGTQLAPGFGELFALDDAQLAQLQRALQASSDRIEEQVVANSTITDNGNGSFTIETKALPASISAEERDRLMGVFKQTLGDEGNQAFALLNGESDNANRANGALSSLFTSYGSESRTITISKTTTPRPLYRYEMKFGASGRGSGSAATLEVIKLRLGSGLKLLPAGF